MSDINLLPHKSEDDGAKQGKKSFIVVCSIIFLIISISIATIMILDLKITSFENKTAELNKEYVKLNVVAKVKNEIKLNQDSIKNMTAIMEQEQGRSLIATGFFDRLSKNMPKAIFAVNVGVSSESEVALTGLAKDSDSIAHFAYNLKQEGFVADVKINNITAENSSLQGNDIQKIHQTYSFTLTAKLKTQEVN